MSSPFTPDRPQPPIRTAGNAARQPMRVAGIILAGGQARRMGGGNKAMLDLGGRPAIAHVIDRLRIAHAISANGDPSRFARFHLPVLADSVPNRPGPLAGILAGMEWAAGQGFTHIVTAAADTPFFPCDLASRLIADAGHAAVVLAADAGPDGLRRHPTFGLWDVALRDDLRRALLDEGLRKASSWADRHGAISACFAGADPFFNINTPDDLAIARARIEA